MSLALLSAKLAYSHSKVVSCQMPSNILSKFEEIISKCLRRRAHPLLFLKFILYINRNEQGACSDLGVKSPCMARDMLRDMSRIYCELHQD